MKPGSTFLFHKWGYELYMNRPRCKDLQNVEWNKSGRFVKCTKCCRRDLWLRVWLKKKKAFSPICTGLLLPGDLMSFRNDRLTSVFHVDEQRLCLTHGYVGMVLRDQLLGSTAHKRNAVKAQTRPHSFRTDSKLHPHFHPNELDKLHFCGPVRGNWLKSTVTEK